MSAEVSCGWQGGQGQCNTLIQAHKAGYSRTVPHCCLGVASLSWAFGSSTWSHQLKTSQKDVGITSHIPSSTQNTSYISTRPMKRTSHSVTGRLLELERLLIFFFFSNWTTVSNTSTECTITKSFRCMKAHCLSDLGLDGANGTRVWNRSFPFSSIHQKHLWHLKSLILVKEIQVRIWLILKW